ncbi:MAG: hypothetical protein ACJATI_003712 [Halioglobus sp.]|jgi:hypothetical protein
MFISKTNIITLLITTLAAIVVVGQEVQINEVVSSNSIFFDDDGNTPDWIELHNSSTTAVNLSGWILTDKENDPKWAFKEKVIEGDGYLLVWASGNDNPQYFPRTLIDQGDNWKYLSPSQPLNLSWINIDYDDGSWPINPSGFGYADGDDATTLPFGVSSVFMRKQFTISDLSIVAKMFLDIDYDDGFVAFLNGKEIARANMVQDRPNYNDYSITDHEAGLYQGIKPDRFEIDKSSLIEGQNVLSIQAHNVSNSSSDFTVIPFLTALFTQENTEGVEPPAVLEYSSSSIHTNFRISEDETLFLYNENGEEVSRLSVGNIPPDVSIGLRPSDYSLTLYEQPTPNEKNKVEGFDGFITEKIEFSNDGGIVDELQLMLASSGENDIILYTTDATIPIMTSEVYSSPITIFKNTVVRARIFKQGLIPSKTQTRTYILDRDHDMPMASLVTEPDNFFSDETGIYVLGDGSFPDFPHFGSNIWEDWERPIHFSLYEQDELTIEFNAGTKIFGGWSRALDQRSLSIFARGQYGLSEIDYPLFPNRPYDKYQAFILRNSGNDFLISNIRDVTLTSLMDGSGLETQAYKPVVTYVNGLYWGLFNMREKMNEHYLASRYGINPDEIDILGPFDEVIQGSSEDYRSMLTFLATNSLTSDESYQWIADQVDIDNFIIYHVAQIYFDNTDWPGNNNKQWRPKNGKWRWILYDTDFGFGTWSTAAFQNNTLAFALEPNGPFWPNPPTATLLFRRLVENTTFRNKFVNQFADELNSRFIPERIAQHIESVAANVASEIPDHYDRWGGNTFDHNQKVDEMIRFGNFRPNRVKEHIKSQFGLPDHHQVTLQVNNSTHGFITVNSLTLDDQIWKGDYFEDVPIKVTAYPKLGYTFSHWIGFGTSTDAELSLDLDSDLSLTALFVPSNDEPLVIINEINYKSSEDYDSGDWIELYNPNDSPVDLINWVITDKEYENGYTFSEGTLLQGGEFLILAKDELKFQNVHGDVQNVKGNLSFGLSSEGEALKIYSAEWLLIDSVSYLPTQPWSEQANGQGYTLELRVPELDNTLPENWASFRFLGSPGVSNDEVSGISIPEDNIQIKRYPNPFVDVVNLEFTLNTSALFSANLYDQKGSFIEKIYENKLASGEHTISKDLSHLDKGIYILELSIGTNEETFQWVKL